MNAGSGFWASNVRSVARLARLTSDLLCGADVDIVPAGGTVPHSAGAHGGAAVPASWNLPDARRRADAYFDVTWRLLPVRLPSPVSAMHWTGPVTARAAGIPNLYCVSDLAALRLPYASPLDKRRLLRRWRAIIDAADHLLVSSEACGQDLARLFAVPRDRFSVVYQACEGDRPQVQNAEDPSHDRVRSVFGLPHRGYYVCHASVETMSNTGRVAEAYLASGTEFPLLIIGPMGYGGHIEAGSIRDDRNRRFERGPSRIAAGRRITFIDDLPRDLLAGVIRGARAVVAPFLYDCVGTAALEAMRFGTPLITSTTGAMPELAAGAALTVDPYDVAAIVEAIRAVDGDSELRASLSRKGLWRAARFSVGAFRARLEAAYRMMGLDQPPEPASASGAPAGGKGRTIAALPAIRQ